MHPRPRLKPAFITGGRWAGKGASHSKGATPLRIQTGSKGNRRYDGKRLAQAVSVNCKYRSLSKH